MWLSDTNPSLAVNAYGGAKNLTALRLVYNCPPNNTDCTWTYAGKAPIIVPDLINLSWSQAQSALESLGLYVRIGSNRGSEVVWQSPAPGTVVKAGSVVTVNLD